MSPTKAGPRERPWREPITLTPTDARIEVDDEATGHRGIADTAPLAICRAAIAATATHHESETPSPGTQEKA